jgi:hypothetical protein
MKWFREIIQSANFNRTIYQLLKLIPAIDIAVDDFLWVIFARQNRVIFREF